MLLTLKENKFWILRKNYHGLNFIQYSTIKLKRYFYPGEISENSQPIWDSWHVSIG